MDNEMNMHYANELRAHLKRIIRGYDEINLFGNLRKLTDNETVQFNGIRQEVDEARQLLAKLIAFEED